MREKGVASFSGAIEPQTSLPIDARMLVNNLNDLIFEDTWMANDGNVYAYKGMIVSVINDMEESNGIYWLKDLPFHDLNNWIKIGDVDYNIIEGMLVHGKSAYEIWLEEGNEGTKQNFLEDISAGKSAYEVWIENGNMGTELDFLESLNGKNVYDVWLEDGNTGTELEFLNSLKGKDLYQVWLDTGNTGSEIDFFNSMKIKGDKGDRGFQGDKGDPGPGFKPDAVGSLLERDVYDGESEGFCYLVIEESALYFRKTVNNGVWVGPLTFIDYGEVKRQARKQALIFG